MSERTWTLDELANNPKLGLSRGTLLKAFETHGPLKKHRGRHEATRASLEAYLGSIGIQASSVLEDRPIG